MAILASVVAIVLVIADQLLKWWAYTALEPLGGFSLIPGWFGLQYVENTGAAWGMFAGQTWYLILLPIVVIVGMLAFLIVKKIKGGLLLWSSTLIITGGLGNLIDRVGLFGRVSMRGNHTNGFVVDYLHIELFEFPVFNLADCCVTIGAGLLILFVVLDELKIRREAKMTVEAENEGDNGAE